MTCNNDTNYCYFTVISNITIILIFYWFKFYLKLAIWHLILQAHCISVTASTPVSQSVNISYRKLLRLLSYSWVIYINQSTCFVSYLNLRHAKRLRDSSHQRVLILTALLFAKARKKTGSRASRWPSMTCQWHLHFVVFIFLFRQATQYTSNAM